jgi:FkbM family methyltransferase
MGYLEMKDKPLQLKTVKVWLKMNPKIVILACILFVSCIMMSKSVPSRLPLDGVELRTNHMEPITFGRKCTSPQIKQYVELSPHKKSNCPSTAEIIKFLSTTSESKSPVLIYAGCNKGDDYINGVRAWSRNKKYSPTAIYDWYNKSGLKVTFACGLDHEIPLDTPPQTILPVRGYCIEPMESNVFMLQSVFTALGYKKPEIQLIQAALSIYPGHAEFPNIIGRAGVANMGLHDAENGKYNTTTVQLLTLDDLVRNEKISKIDYLSLDTEGNDMQVILGGVRLLASQAVRYFEFEHHKVARWFTSSLRDMIELADSFGYDCYWTLNDGKLARLTGCWSDVYLEKFWSNVGCINRKDERASAFMESLATY